MHAGERPDMLGIVHGTVSIQKMHKVEAGLKISK